MEHLENILNQLSDNHECYYIGDFNIDYADAVAVRRSKIKVFESRNNLSQLITQSTRVTATSAI